MSSIEIHIVTQRPLLDEFINLWNSVNVPCDSYIKVLSTSYSEKNFSLNNGIKVEYIRQKTFPKTTSSNHAWARNELLCHADSEYILFFDDWQRPNDNILIEHLNYLRQNYAICGRRLECDKDGLNCKEDNRYGAGYIRACSYGWFYTCNASAPYANIIKLNGFDNRFCGGTAGEDYDLGMRLERSGIKMVYNPNAISFHYSHDHLGSLHRNELPCARSHNLSPYKYIPEYNHFGDWNLMTGDDFEFWWEGPIKYYKCKRCGTIGVLDSIQVYQYNRDNNIIKIENGMEQIRECLDR